MAWELDPLARDHPMDFIFGSYVSNASCLAGFESGAELAAIPAAELAAAPGVGASFRLVDVAVMPLSIWTKHLPARLPAALPTPC